MAKQSFINPAPAPVLREQRPLQIPQGGADSASIILKAAGLTQDNEQFKAQMQQKSLEGLSNTLMAYAELEQRKREAEVKKAETAALIEFKNAQTALSKRAVENELQPIYDNAGNIIGFQRFTTRGTEATTLPKGQNQRIRAQDDPERLLSSQELQQYGAVAGTRVKDVFGQIPVSPANRKAMQEISSSLPILDSIGGMINKLEFGNSLGEAEISGARMYTKSLLRGTDEAQFASAIKNISNIARGMGERGVLTNEDLNRILQDLPTFRDTRESAMKRVERIRNIMVGAQENFKKGLRGDILKAGGEQTKIQVEVISGTNKGKRGRIPESEFDPKIYRKL